MHTEPSPAPRFPRVLVTGAAGFVGHHLVRELEAAGHTVLTTDAAPAGSPAAAGLPSYAPVDLRDAAALQALVRDARPDAVVHLAAISYVPDNAHDPALALCVNIGGTWALADALRAEAPHARLLFVSTAQVYGTAPAAAPLREDSPLLPLSLYAVTKVACERFLLARHAVDGLDAVVARPGNHTGPGQSPKFVAPAFARKVLDALAGRAPSVRVGNLDSVRSFADVRDVVRAYRLLLERGASGGVYNVAAPANVRIGDLLDRLFALAGGRAPIEADPALWRPTDACQDIDASRLRADTGWEPLLSLDDTLRDLLEDARRRP